ncbi:MAG: ribulose-phosphate 3-epimerase [Succinivibrio sp.]|nr:ribulose-phosphate 3-epimerase [Succinivibrio sp.]
MSSKLFAGSILSADFLNLEHDVTEALEAGIDLIHFDVMDFHFVPNMTFGPMFLKALKQKFPQVLFDAHLMCDPITDEVVDAYIKAGADFLTFHPEACHHTERMLTRIKQAGVKAGLALNPATPPQLLRYLWDKLDMVLVMTVNPGFGGQTVLPACLKKIQDVKRMAAEANVRPYVEVDGGVNPMTISQIADTGANVFVVGSAFFGAPDKKLALSELKQHAGV